jgi:hypothetical protein
MAGNKNLELLKLVATKYYASANNHLSSTIQQDTSFTMPLSIAFVDEYVNDVPDVILVDEIKQLTGFTITVKR